MILAACAAALCAFIAPAAAGSGIPEVKAYLNGIDAHSILAPSTLLVKVGKTYGDDLPFLHAQIFSYQIIFFPSTNRHLIF